MFRTVGISLTGGGSNPSFPTFVYCRSGSTVGRVTVREYLRVLSSITSFTGYLVRFQGAALLFR